MSYAFSRQCDVFCSILRGLGTTPDHYIRSSGSSWADPSIQGGVSWENVALEQSWCSKKRCHGSLPVFGAFKHIKYTVHLHKRCTIGYRVVYLQMTPSGILTSLLAGLCSSCQSWCELSLTLSVQAHGDIRFLSLYQHQQEPRPILRCSERLSKQLW